MKLMTQKQAEVAITKECKRVGVDEIKMQRVIKNMKQLVKGANKDQLAVLLSVQVAMINQTRVLFHQKLKTGLWTPGGGKSGLIKPGA